MRRHNSKATPASFVVLKEHEVKYNPIEHKATRSMQHENTRKEVLPCSSYMNLDKAKQLMM